MPKISLTQKMMAGFICAGMLIVLGGILGPLGISKVGEELVEFTSTLFSATYHLGVLKEGQRSVQKLEYAFLAQENSAKENEKERIYGELKETWEKTDKAWKEMESLARSFSIELWEKSRSSWENWRALHQEFIRQWKEGKRNEALALFNGKERELFIENERNLNTLTQGLAQWREQAVQTGREETGRMKAFIVGGTILGIFLTLFWGGFFSRSVTRPIRRIIQGLTETCAQFESTARQIATASQQLAAGTSAQAAAVEEASSVSAELSSSIQKNTEEVEKLQVISGDSTVVGQEAFEFFRQAKKATKEIKLASEETAKIVKTIGEIAFQTNLLALSASVEAAQSNEAGIGFSVVAQEVRNLAKRSTEAAKDTSALIDETLRVITKGDNLVRASLGSFISYGEASAPINSFSAKAAEVAQKQAQGIAQINIALGEISHSAQNNAAGAQEAASAAQEISAQSAHLSRVLDELKMLVG